MDWKPFKKEGLFVFGVDEVGRGCLAGEVYAAAVILPHHEWDQELTDSKLLSEDRREMWAAKISESAQCGIGIASLDEIASLNILHASLLAMKRAVESIKGLNSGTVLIDGNKKISGLSPRYVQQTFVKGDLRLAPISAASIIAKVARDRKMKELAREYPGYGFETHKGYATPEHKQAIQKLGPTALHRKTFSGVKEYLAL